mmetsp:Transcript_6916/g.12224  ORF Transcript_6916/g.12224 Transcript_6916/m.12224 type:complete len:208 (+) Transcript_6916:7-630(+)
MQKGVVILADNRYHSEIQTCSGRLQTSDKTPSTSHGSRCHLLLGTNARHAELLDVAIVSPGGSHCLELCVEVHTSLAVEVEIAQNGPLVPREREHWQWHWDWDVHSHLASFDFVDKLSGSSSTPGEYGSSVAEWILVHKLDGFFEGPHFNATKHWSKDLLVIDLHATLDLAEDGRANEVTILVGSRNRWITTIKVTLCSFVNARLNQ